MDGFSEATHEDYDQRQLTSRHYAGYSDQGCRLSSNNNIRQVDNILSQKCLAKQVLENDGVTFVEDQKAFLVNGHTNEIYAVTVYSNESCNCHSTITCHYILAVRTEMEDDLHQPKKINNSFEKSRKRNDKKSDKKKPQTDDYDKEVVANPESDEGNIARYCTE